MRRRLLLVRITMAVVIVLGGVQACGPNEKSGDGSDWVVEEMSWGGLKRLFGGDEFASGGASQPRDTGSEVRYPIRDSPEHALEKLVEAYNLMDADAFIDCLSDTFMFWLKTQDVIDDPTLPWSWGLAAEADIHLDMFGDGSTESIHLMLTQYGGAIEIPGPHPEDPSVWMYQEDCDLRVYMPDGVMLWANEGARFELSVDPNEVGPSGEELWEVSTWLDVEGFSTPVEPTRGSGMKALFW